jgi:hypothetical protein
LARGQPVNNETIIERSIIKPEVRREFASTRKSNAWVLSRVSACLPDGFITVLEYQVN